MLSVLWVLARPEVRSEDADALPPRQRKPPRDAAQAGARHSGAPRR